MRSSGLALALILAAGLGSAVYLAFDAGYLSQSDLVDPSPQERFYPAPNVARKADRIPLTTIPASFRFGDPANEPPGDQLRQSFAALDALAGLRREPQLPAFDDPQALEPQAHGTPALDAPMPRPRPKSIVRRQQSSYALLSDLQIEAIKTRLKLTPAQEAAWPPVEEALRGLAARVQDARKSGGGLAGSDEVARFKAAAAPFLSQLSSAQKRDLKMLAHIIGLSTVVAML